MLQTTSPEMKALSILHSAFLMGQVLFAAISLFVGYSQNISLPALQPYSQELMIAAIVVGALSYIAAKNLFTKRLEQINADHQPVADKFNAYRAACITQWGLIEFASLLAIILFLLTNNYFTLIVSAVLILLFLTTRPSLHKAASDLGISEKEIEQIKGNAS